MRAVAVVSLVLAAACSSNPPVMTPMDSGTPLTCDAPLRACAGSCADLQMDSAHCGECGRACATGESCAGGACYPNACGGMSCPASHVCVGSQCVERVCFGMACPAGEACAGGSCYPTACGGTTCGAAEVCVMGACAEAACVGVLCPRGALCVQGACVEDTCTNGLKDGAESDTDCGGVCPPCLVGQTCAAPLDCGSLSCVSAKCAAPSCVDQLKNGDEGDTDCGGSCAPCAEGRRCSEAAHCASGVCTAGRCAASSCTDRVKNGTETDVDCGGGCPACAGGLTCAAPTDCQSGLCSTGRCVPPQCQNGTQDGTETGLDCGGGTCASCPVGQGCAQGADCQSGVCGMGTPRTCQPPSCTDVLKNGQETDVDCGGLMCLACAAGRSCSVPGDCQSRVCRNTRCATPTCTDGVTNGGESDVDCGGATTSCPRCGFNAVCSTGGDCISGTCTTLRCTAPPLFVASAPSMAPAATQGLAVADLDADGNLDVAVTAGYAAVVWWGLGNGSFAAPSSFSVPGGSSSNNFGNYLAPTGVAVVDLNADGRRDLVTGQSAQFGGNITGCRVNVLHGAGSRSFAPAVNVEDPDMNNMLSGCGYTLTVGRFDGDSFDDLFVGDNFPLINDGEYFGGFLLKGASSAYPALARVPGAGAWVTTADVNGDGAVDVISHRMRSARVSAFISDGMGGFSEQRIVPVPPGIGGITPYDFNGDQRPDFVAATDQGNAVNVALTDGSGSWLAPRAYAVPSARDVKVGDFDRDGIADLVVATTGLAFLKGHADGTFDNAVQYATAAGAIESIGVGDFDGDGKLDVAGRTTNAMVFFRNTLP